MDKSPSTILVVEDNSNDAASIRRGLETQYPDANIKIVATTREYLESIAADTPLIVIMNLYLKGSGTIHLLKSSMIDALFPVIIICNQGNEQVAVDVIKAGARDYIVKSPEAFASMAYTVARTLREWSLLMEKKQMEKLLKESQARATQQEKMASIGQLAAGVAHEINNPMGYITSNMNTLGKHVTKLVQYIEFLEQSMEKCGDQDVKASITVQKRHIKLDYVLKDLRELIAESLEGSQRVSKIVQDLKSFSRIEGNESLPSNLNECIKNIINIVRNEIKYVAELDLRLGDIPLVVCRPQQIGQVVMNLLINAAHSISGNGLIILQTSQVGDAVEISVTDNGSGISPGNLEKIFEPFFTTKETGVGTGLGLAICCDIVNKHGGEMMVQSEVGKGTTFTVRLPVGTVTK